MPSGTVTGVRVSEVCFAANHSSLATILVDVDQGHASRHMPANGHVLHSLWLVAKMISLGRTLKIFLLYFSTFSDEWLS